MPVRVLSLLLLVFAATAAPAQSPDPTAELQQLQVRLEQINAELTEIQETAFEANPALGERRDALMDSIDAKMAETGFDGPETRAAMDSLATAYDDSSLTDAERTGIEQTMQSNQGAYQQAQQMAMQDPAIQESLQTLNTELLEAMQEADARTDTLVQEMQMARQRFQMLMQAMMQQRQQMQSPVPPDGGGGRR